MTNVSRRVVINQRINEFARARIIAAHLLHVISIILLSMATHYTYKDSLDTLGTHNVTSRFAISRTYFILAVIPELNAKAELADHSDCLS